MGSGLAASRRPGMTERTLGDPRQSGEGPDEALEKLAEGLLDFGRDLARVADRPDELRPRGPDVTQHRRLEAPDIRQRDRIEIAAGTGEDRYHLLLHRNRR